MSASEARASVLLATSRARRFLTPLVPYFAVTIGLLLLHNAWLAILSYHAGIVGVTLLADKRPDFKSAFRNNKLLVIVLAALAGFSGGLLFYLVSPFMGISDDVSSYITSIGLDGTTWPLFLIYFVLVNPLLEEYYWRGLLAGESSGLMVNDLLFSGYHILVLAGQIDALWLVVVFLSLSAGAWFWRQMNRVNRGLSASLASHFAADLAVILAIYSFSAP